jgi:hypothetical protein
VRLPCTLVDKHQPTWAEKSSAVPCILTRDTFSVQPRRGLRQVQVTKEDCKQAEQASSKVTRIIQAQPDDDDSPISVFDGCTEPDSAASLRQTAGDLTPETVACHFACDPRNVIVPRQPRDFDNYRRHYIFECIDTDCHRVSRQPVRRQQPPQLHNRVYGQ